MTLLPIIERELRAATRRRATRWSRSLAAVGASLVALWILMSVHSLTGFSGAGLALFSTLTNLAFLACLFAGVFLTADCLSEEKRTGTLGLLFLTDLKGFEVVVGKLLATSLTAGYGFLAVLPILALPVVMGGVGFGSVCRAVLALSSTLLFSLTAGMFVSSISWKEQKAMLAAGGLLFLASFVLPALGELQWLSPRTAFDLAVSATPQLLPFFDSLLGLWAASGLFLLLATRVGQSSRLTERIMSYASGQATSESEAASTTAASDHAELEPPRGQPAAAPENLEDNISVLEDDKSERRRRREMLESNPVQWFAGRKLSSVWIRLSLALLGGGWFVVCLQDSNSSIAPFRESFYMAISFHALLKFWMGWEASQRFCEARRNGVLELLLSAPLNEEEILLGQFRSLVKQFTRPVCGILGLDLLMMTWLGSCSIFPPFSLEAICSFLAMMVLLVIDLWGLAWVGLWLGLKARKGWVAAFGALSLIMLLPSALFVGLVFLLGPALPEDLLRLVGLWVFVGATTSTVFGAKARANLRTRLREAAASGGRYATRWAAHGTVH